MRQSRWNMFIMLRLDRVVLVAALAAAASAEFTQSTPRYSNTYKDAVTGDNSFSSGGSRYWDVDAGADSYQNDLYERATSQTYQKLGSRYGSGEYFEYLDITEARLGFDDKYLYVAIDMFGLNKSTKDGANTRVGLMERYGFRFGSDLDGRYSSLFYVDQPGSLGSSFSSQKTFAYRDSDGDVGGRGKFSGSASGRSVTKSDNAAEEAGMNGYDTQFISDGMANGQSVFFARVNPNDETVVEFALDYQRLGLSSTDLLSFRYLEFEAIKGGPKDPQNYLWNDKYTKMEAGSPYLGTGGLSEYGTQGLGNLYELDTVRGAGVVPEPGLAAFLGVGLIGLLKRRKSA
jgi:hypothetical protein